MFSKETIEQIELVARENAIDPAALLAISEIESGGKAFAWVGGKKEPLIRFEGHYFDRLLDLEKRAIARKAGLAAPKWGVVKNRRTQADRWKMLEQAMRIDRDAALQSISWGIGQVMGSHWKALGYASPSALVLEARSGVAGQVRLMLRFISVNNLMGKIAARDWAGFARRYNGPAYRKNHYDTRLAAAYTRHKNHKLRKRSPSVTSSSKFLSMAVKNEPNAVHDMQRSLTAAGYPVNVDGDFGPRTDAALRLFQKQNGLVVDGVYGPVSRTTLENSLPKIGSAAKFWQLLGRLAWILSRGRLGEKFKRFK